MKKLLIILKSLCILLAISLYLGTSLAYTDETGRYNLTGLSGGNYTVYADSPYGTNLAGNSTDVIVRLGETSNADIMLHEGGVITGKVTYVNGTGIPNSSIKASGSDWRHGPKNAYTDETGRYTLTGLKGGNYTVYADSPYGTNLAGNSTDVIVRLGETSNADIVLHEGGVITGKVTYVNGTRIANSSIKASGPDCKYGPDWIYAYKDEKGGYILTGLKDGNYTVYADSPYGTNLVGNNTDVIVRLGETSNADIVLHEGGVITGKVTYVNGTGIANSSIKASGSDWRYGPKNAYTDETGRYTLTGLKDGNYTVYADSPYGTNLAGNSTDAIVRLGETSNADIVLHEGGVITGKVTYVNRTGIANSSIKTSGSDWRHGPKNAYTDETGRYTLTGLKSGNYTVYADSPYGTNLAGNSTDVIVRLGETSNADIVLHEGGVITGKVTYVNGTGIPNSSIRASGSDWKDAYTDETGRYNLTGLCGGNYIVYADSPYGTNLVENRTDVIVRLGETSNADIVLHGGGVITGKVTYVNGTGIPNSSVEIIGEGGGGGGGDFPIFPFVDNTPSQKIPMLIYPPPEKKDITIFDIATFLGGIAAIGYFIDKWRQNKQLEIPDLEITEEVVSSLLGTKTGGGLAHRIKVKNKGKIAAENVCGIIECLNYKKFESRTSWHEGEKDVPYTTINSGDHMFLNIYGIIMRRSSNSLVSKTDDITMATENGWNWHHLIDTSLDLKFAVRVTAKNASPKRKVFEISQKNNLDMKFLDED